MNLISCDNCGVVFDKDKLEFPTIDDIYKDDGSIDEDKAIYCNRDWLPFVPCPVCESPVT